MTDSSDATEPEEGTAVTFWENPRIGSAGLSYGLWMVFVNLIGLMLLIVVTFGTGSGFVIVVPLLLVSQRWAARTAIAGATPGSATLSRAEIEGGCRSPLVELADSRAVAQFRTTDGAVGLIAGPLSALTSIAETGDSLALPGYRKNALSILWPTCVLSVIVALLCIPLACVWMIPIFAGFVGWVLLCFVGGGKMAAACAGSPCSRESVRIPSSWGSIAIRLRGEVIVTRARDTLEMTGENVRQELPWTRIVAMQFPTPEQAAASQYLLEGWIGVADRPPRAEPEGQG